MTSYADQGVLYLTLYKQWFVEILEGRKHVEYRRRTARYDKMFTKQEYSHVVFTNGYGYERPWMIVEIREFECTEEQWLIHLGGVVVSGNLDVL